MTLQFQNHEAKRFMLTHILSEVLVDGIYDKLSGDLFVDCGAQVGIVSMYVAKAFKKVIAFEPSPEAFEKLVNHVKLDGADNIDLHRLAVSGKSGKVRFGINPGNQTMSKITQEGEIEVEATTIPAIISLYGRINCLKLDIEGAEDEVIRSEGFKNSVGMIDNIIIEFHFNATGLVPILNSYGYSGERFKTMFGSEVWHFWRSK